MQNDERRIAVFIDFENVAMGVRESKYGNFDIDLVLKRLVEKGKIMVKRAYSDWHRYGEFKRAFHQAAIELIDVPQTRYSGKNSADIRMVVDALDLSYQKEHIDTFVLVSGDSDFSPLVSKLRENGRYVIGMGVKQSSSDLLINNCDEFIFYEDLVRPTAAVPVVDPKLHHLSPKKAEAIRLVLETFQALQREGKEVIYGSMIKQTLIRKLPSFNETYYGYPMFSRLLEDAAENKLLRLTKDQKSGGYIVTLPSETAQPAPAEGGAENGQGSELAVNGSSSGLAVPMEPRDKFRRSRWERGRPHRPASRFGEGTPSVRPFPLPAAAPSQSGGSESTPPMETVPPSVEPGVEPASRPASDPAVVAAAELETPAADPGVAVPQGHELPLAGEAELAAEPRPQQKRGRRSRRSQRFRKAAVSMARSSAQPAAQRVALEKAAMPAESALVASDRDESVLPDTVSSETSHGGALKTSASSSDRGVEKGAEPGPAASSRKRGSGRRSSNSGGRSRKAGTKKTKPE